MAGIGLSWPYVAKYEADNNGDVTYSEGQVLAKLVDMSTSIEAGGDNSLYADNGVAEVDNTFGGGELSITTDDLIQAASALILGITPSTVTVGSTEVTELVYNDTMIPPYLGFGCVVKKQKDGAMKWRAIVFSKIKFNVFDESATTQGETIEWQTPTIDAIIMRDDSEEHQWKREATFATEGEARAYIKAILGVSA